MREPQDLRPLLSDRVFGTRSLTHPLLDVAPDGNRVELKIQPQLLRLKLGPHALHGFEDVRPMSAAVQEALTEVRKVQRAIGSAPVFPAPKDPTKPCDRHLLDNWLRRKWATERKGYPVKDVAAAGGWRDERTILTSYRQADAATVRRVVLRPTQRLVGS